MISEKNIFVENCQKIKIEDFLKEFRFELKKIIIESAIEVEGLDISLAVSKTNFGGTRFWFLCPLCGKRIRFIFQHPITHRIGCRVCLVLKYLKR